MGIVYALELCFELTRDIRWRLVPQLPPNAGTKFANLICCCIPNGTGGPDWDESRSEMPDLITAVQLGHGKITSLETLRQQTWCVGGGLRTCRKPLKNTLRMFHSWIYGDTCITRWWSSTKSWTKIFLSDNLKQFTRWTDYMSGCLVSTVLCGLMFISSNACRIVCDLVFVCVQRPVIFFVLGYSVWNSYCQIKLPSEKAQIYSIERVNWNCY